MPKGKKFGGRDFKPGQSGNIKGRPPIPPEVKQIREMNNKRFAELFNNFSNMPLPELVEIIKNKETPSIEVFIANIIYKGSVEADYGRFDALMNRIAGKPKMVIEANITDEAKKHRIDKSLEILKSILEERKSNAADEFFAIGLLNELKK